MLKRLFSMFMRSRGGRHGRRGGYGRRGRHGSTGARLGSQVERFIRRRL